MAKVIMSAISDQTPDVYTYTRTMQFSLPSANSAEPSPEIAVSTSREAWSVRQSPSSNESQSNRQQLAAKKALEYNRSLENILEKTRQKIEQQKISEDLQLAEMLKHNDAKNAGLVKGLGELVGAHERRRERRKQLLWKSWHDQVYSRIQGQISEQLAAMSNEEIGDRRRELMDAYIKTADSKEKGVFRDVIFTTEYDPLTARDHYIKYASPRYDPLKAGGGNFGPSDSDGTNARSQQMCRATLIDLHTAYARYESTPQNSPRANTPRGVAKLMDHYSAQAREHEGAAILYPFNEYSNSRERIATVAEVDSEFPRGKRTYLAPAV